MGQENTEIVLREQMEGQANGGENNLDPVFYVPPYTPNQLRELEVPLEPLLQSLHSSPVCEQANEGCLPGTISSANQLSQFRQEQTGASVLELGILLRQQTTLKDFQLSILTRLNFRYIGIRF